MDLKTERILLCEKYGAPFCDTLSSQIVGISKDFQYGKWPVNGLRHPLTGNTSGWYIWTGEEFSSEPDFFVPIHTAHLEELYPKMMKYLGLAPGWRFLITDTYEDVWEDTSLLNP